MGPDEVIDIGQRALEVMVLLAAPMLLAALLVGVVVGMLQAATQINELTLSFVPKLIVVALVLMAAGPWMLGLIVDFTRELMEAVPQLVGG
ncbi:flagellar biosynthesis protein FliQ [Inmirania thermothiophila]|uniref:Flagellar biosynthetic protein FliQ n=1 Tax=Inmirania thermothiophila TaxID=1750597 RepID=A0A3N1Y863_9GAMM|nr:flagellar biosynthesis protein FliQ [Inmirania thermothiophila]ROR34940.1 flagellar biosynthetic protein FliQ [Inmirania thermothiophila]